MTDLPEDPNRWPSDPFEVLNLKRTDDARTARRAYFKLVRRFKPDQNPVEFQKVHEAYERVQAWMRYNSPPEIESDEAGEPQWSGDFLHLDENKTGPRDSEQSGFGSSLEPDSLEQFYEELENGNVDQAVACVNQVGESDGPAKKAEANLIKYHLSNFMEPAIEDSVNPFEDQWQYGSQDQKRLSWLLKSLDSNGLYQPILSALGTEFDRNFRLANCEPFNRFLEGIEDSRKLSDVLRLRWEAIGHHDQNLVVDDVVAVRRKSLGLDGDSAQLIDVLATSMNYTVWKNDERCAQHNRECWQQISESRQNWLADSVELQILAAEEWKVLRREYEWASALPWSRCSLVETARSIWNPVAVAIAAKPVNSLRRLNTLFQKYSIAMSVFEEGLRRNADLSLGDDVSESWDETRDIVACFFKQAVKKTGTTKYATNREAIMDFCLLNRLAPNSFAHAANTFLPPNATVSWTELLQKDGPLLCVYHACRAVWS